VMRSTSANSRSQLVIRPRLRKAIRSFLAGQGTSDLSSARVGKRHLAPHHRLLIDARRSGKTREAASPASV
jgi:hypothetical protein